MSVVEGLRSLRAGGEGDAEAIVGPYQPGKHLSSLWPTGLQVKRGDPPSLIERVPILKRMLPT